MLTYRRPLVLCLGLVLALSLSPLMAQEEGADPAPEKAKVDLSLGLKTGDELVYYTFTERTTKVDAPDAAETRLERRLWEKWTVAEAKEGRFEIQVEMTRVAEKQTGDTTFDFDSEGKKAEDLAKIVAENPRAAPLAGLVGKTYSMTVTSGGVVEKVEGLEEYFASIRKGLEGSEDAGAKEVARVLAEEAKPENFKENLRPILAFLQGGAAEVGSKWKAGLSHRVPGAGVLREEVEYTLGTPDANGRVEVTYTSAAAFEEAKDRAKLFKDIAFELTDGTGKGSVVLDTTNGWIWTATSDLSWKVRITLKAEPAVQVEQAVVQKTEVRLDRHERKAEEKPAEEKPAEEKPAEEKPAEEKPGEAGVAPVEEKPAEEKPGEGGGSGG